MAIEFFIQIPSLLLPPLFSIEPVIPEEFIQGLNKALPPNWGTVRPEILLGVCMALGLSAACGLRLFLPPLLLSAAGLFFGLPLPEAMQWMAGEIPFFILLVATLFEIGAYYIPWLDNALDTIATPLAVVAGTLLTGGFLGELDPVWRWSLALLAGGGAAGGMQSISHLTRLASTATTGGLANPLIATAEAILSTIVAVSVMFLPLLSIVVIATIGMALILLGMGAQKLFTQMRPPAQPPMDASEQATPKSFTV